MKKGRRYILKQMFNKQSLVWGAYDGTMKGNIERRWYWFKLMICLLFNMRIKEQYEKPDVVMLVFDHRCCYIWGDPASEWTEISVGQGVFKNWFYMHYSNGT